MYKKMTMTKIVKKIEEVTKYVEDYNIQVMAYQGDMEAESVEIEVDVYTTRYNGDTEMHTIEVASIPMEEIDEKLEKKIIKDVDSIGKKLHKYYEERGLKNPITVFADHFIVA